MKKFGSFIFNQFFLKLIGNIIINNMKIMLKIKSLHKTSSRSIVTKYNDHFSKSRLLSIEFSLKQIMWRHPSCYDLKEVDQKLCDVIFESNPKLFEYIPGSLITKKMIDVVSNEHPHLLNRIDIGDKIDSAYYKNYTLVVHTLINIVSNNSLLFEIVPIKYQDLVFQKLDVNLQKKIKSYKITNNIDEWIKKSIDHYINLLEGVEETWNPTLWKTAKFIKLDHEFKKHQFKFNYLIINSVNIDKNLSDVIIKHGGSYRISTISEKFITKKAIDDNITKYPESVLCWNIPETYLYKVLKQILEKDIHCVHRMSKYQLSKLTLEDFIDIVKKKPYAINCVPDKWKLLVLESQNDKFYNLNTLENFHNLILPSNWFNKYFGHIKIYDIRNDKGNKLKGFYIQSRGDNCGIPDGSGDYKIPKNSLTWDPEWLTKMCNINSYTSNICKIPDNCTIEILPNISSVEIKNE